VIYQSFISFVEAVVLPRRAANPAHRRLDGQTTGGNRESSGRFKHRGSTWVVHADTHYEPLVAAYEAALLGTDPFLEAPTRSGTCLDLVADVRSTLADTRFKYLYIYEVG